MIALTVSSGILPKVGKVSMPEQTRGNSSPQKPTCCLASNNAWAKTCTSSSGRLKYAALGVFQTVVSPSGLS